jgi:hypothetical protein
MDGRAEKVNQSRLNYYQPPPPHTHTHPFPSPQPRQREFNRRLDGYSRPFFIFFAAGRHLGFRLDFLCWVMTSATAFASLASADPSSGVSGWCVRACVRGWVNERTKACMNERVRERRRAGLPYPNPRDGMALRGVA